MTTIEIQTKLQEKQARLISIVGEKEGKAMMEKALKMVKAGKKSIRDVIDF